MMSSSDLLVGIDVGGTKVALRAQTVDGQAVCDIVVGSREWEAEPEDQAARYLDDVLGRVVGPANISQLVVGAQGLNTPAVSRNLEIELQDLGYRRVKCVNDAELLPAAADEDKAIALVTGTGSIAIGWGPAGNLMQAGGWGWILGDDAGGAAIVREAVRSVLDAHDWGRDDVLLLEALLGEFGASDAERLARVVNDDSRIDNWAPHAPAIFDVAEAGSTLAQMVIRNAAAHAVLLVDQLLARGAVADAVVAAGSIVQKSKLFEENLRTQLVTRVPGMRLVVLEEQPVAGALALARQAVGTEF